MKAVLDTSQNVLPQTQKVHHIISFKRDGKTLTDASEIKEKEEEKNNLRIQYVSKYQHTFSRNFI